jgi:hypothetical protein
MREKKLRSLFIVRKVVEGKENWDFDRMKQ